MDTFRSLYVFPGQEQRINFLIHYVMGVNQGVLPAACYSGNIWQTWGITCNFILILIADTCNGLQRQFDGQQEFCSKNLTVNEIKTKCMAFGKIETVHETFKGKVTEQVYQYKFLGNILKSAKRLYQSIFAENHQYLANQAKKLLVPYIYKSTGCWNPPSTYNASHRRLSC